jgi:hypothetical protein
MPAYIKVNDTVTLTVVFLDITGDYGEPVTNINYVLVEVFDEDGQMLPDYPKNAEEGDSVGQYIYKWTPTDIGEFTVRFTGSYENTSVSIVEEVFYVGIESPTSPALGQDVTFTFGTMLDPLMISPDVITQFTEATELEIAELIYKFSSEVYRYFKSESNIPASAYEYVYYAVLCSLSRVYGGDAFTEGGGFTLGDLSVQERSASSTKELNLANAKSFCELALLYRQDMFRGSGRMKAIVRGANFPNKMPKRHLKDHYKVGPRRITDV